MTIIDFQILGEVPEADANREGLSEDGVPQSIKLKRAQANKLQKLFLNGVEAAMDKLGLDQDDEESANESSQDDQASEKAETKPKKAAPARKILRVKRDKVTPKSQPALIEESKAPAALSKKRPARVAKKAATKAKEENESEEEKDDEEAV